MQNASDGKTPKDVNDLFDALLGNRLTGQVGVLDDISNIKRDVNELKGNLSEVKGSVSEVKGNVAIMDGRLSRRIDGVESGVSTMQVGVTDMQASMEKIQVAIDSRNGERDESDERIVISQNRLLGYVVVGVAVGVTIAIVSYLIFGGENTIDPNSGFALPALLHHLYGDGGYYSRHLALSSNEALATTAHALLVWLRRAALLSDGFLA